MKILVLNSGSSSQKARFYDLKPPPPDDPPEPQWDGKLEWRDDRATFEIRTSSGAISKEGAKKSDRSSATAQLLGELASGKTRVLASLSEIDVVGHRIVNGGRNCNQPTVITGEVKAAIEKMAVFAPLHNRLELEGIALIEKLCGAVPQIAVFDTGFHHKLPEAASIYPGPYAWAQKGIRKLGFHGINHQYCAQRAVALLNRNLADLNLVTCHLGNGCSLAAIRGGQSIDTTMGFTPLDGLMMGTRSGSIDPGILPYLLRRGRLQPEEIDDVLNRKSGLLGISGLSSDMRDILAAIKQGHSRARLAFDIYVHRLQAGIGAMAAVLGGIDALVFTAGVGENSPEVREAACKPLSFLGLKLDEAANAQTSPDADIGTAGSQARVLLIRAQEDWAIAQSSCAQIGRAHVCTPVTWPARMPSSA